MKALVLANFYWPQLTIIALFIFMGIFIGAGFWVYRKSSRELYAYLERLPLNDN